MSQNYDCIIVGGSITGLAAAQELSRNSDALLIEANPKIGYLFRCSGFINTAGFEEFNLERRSIQNSISNLRVIHENKILLFKGDKVAGFVTERPELERSILTGLEGKVAILANTKVLKVSGDSVLTTNGTFYSDYIIGADGTNSTVRKSIGIEDPKFVTAVQFEMNGSFEKDTATIYVGEAFMPFHLWVIPVNESLARIGIGTTLSMKEGVQRLKQLVKKYDIADLHGIEKNRFMTNTLPITMLDSFGAGNTMLAGMAGSIIKPLSLGGIYFGMLSGKAAADSVEDGTGVQGYRTKLDKIGLLQRMASEFAYLKMWNTLYDSSLSAGIDDIISERGAEFKLVDNNAHTTGITSVIKLLINSSIKYRVK
ncbi:MAG: FAD-dependent monooxygenase [Candidatus Micrarchaeaceae archaeon]